MKYYIIAGEASGDLHGGNLIKSLHAKDSTSEYRCWGGEQMQSQGGVLVKHYKDLAFMGFVEVIKNLPTIIGLIDLCKKDILAYKPDVIVLIDYPGFNLRIAKWAKKQGFKIVYYITPQVWAWHKNRVHDLGKYTDKLLVILPFEKAFFAKYNIESIFVGHPLLDAIQQYSQQGLEEINGSVLALLPGSRKQEISNMLPIMLEAAKSYSGTVVIAGAPSVESSFYDKIISQTSQPQTIKLVINRTYDILSVADTALVSSGTATLETALFGVPQIVCYKGNSISFFIAKRLVHLKYISLVNLILDRQVVTELLQNDLTPENITAAWQSMDINVMKKEYATLVSALGTTGASDKAASEIIQLADT
jgi:lipid-A-disaccharide synthase